MENKTVIGLICLLWLVSACDLNGSQEECDYSARLLFHYSKGGSQNQLRTYVTSITDYLYNDRGELMNITTRKNTAVTQRTLDLAPGRYTLVSWGNLADRTLVHPSQNLGTKLTDMHLVQNAAEQPNTAEQPNACTPGAENVPTQQQAERLHYGREEFTIGPIGVMQRTVFMGHAYLDLTITVVGMAGTQGEAFTMQLEGTHPVSSLMPYERINAQGYDMYIPEPDRLQLVTHRLACTLNHYSELEQEFIAYRLTNDSRPVFSIWQGSQQVMRNVDLKKFFDTMLIVMDTNECQEFHLRITVDGDNIYVQFVTLGDWVDGGSVG